MKYLGVDYGEKRIGLAISDETGLIASPMPVLKVKSLPDAVKKLQRIVKNQNVDKLIIGLPLNQKGGETQQSIKTRYFAQAFENTNGTEVEFWNESYTSAQAKKTSTKGTSRKRKNLDSEAARIILQEYLDSQQAKKQGRSFIPQEQLLY